MIKNHIDNMSKWHNVKATEYQTKKMPSYKIPKLATKLPLTDKIQVLGQNYLGQNWIAPTKSISEKLSENFGQKSPTII